MKKILLTVFTIAGMIGLASAQYVDQALIFSQQNFGSTARSKAMGNAFGALGGDFSSLSINPAGIGIYQSSELSLSTSLNINNTQSTYQGQTANDGSTNFNMRNFGYVFSRPNGNTSSGLVSFNYGIGFNRLNNFNQNITTQAKGSPYSRMDGFALSSSLITSSSFFNENNPYANVPWESKLAWENYLIDVTNPDANGIGNQYQSILLANELVDQLQSINREGYVNEIPISFGANFNHKFYLGVTIGIHDLYYNESKTYGETGGFGNFDYVTNDRIRGSGYNLKFGVIYRPTSSLRIGAAIHTPTYYDLKETYDAEMSSNLTNVSTAANGTHDELSPVGHYNYNLETPFRAIGSVAYQFGKKGLISFDYEYVDYSNMKLRNNLDAVNIANDNQSISSAYRAVSNIHIGGELRATDALSLRAGYELFGNPYQSAITYLFPLNRVEQPNIKFNFNTINCGIGYRIDNVSLDLAYSLSDRTSYMYLFQPDGSSNLGIKTPNDYQLNSTVVSPVKYHSLLSEVIFTIGIRL